MNLDIFIETFFTQMNNPECSYLVGMQIGQWFLIRWIVIIFAINLVYSLLSKGLKLAYEHIKKKIKLKQSKDEGE